jgi:hypothetical protein
MIKTATIMEKYERKMANANVREVAVMIMIAQKQSRDPIR